MCGTFGLSSSQGGQSRVDSFGERYGGVAVDDTGPTKNLSNIPITVIKPGSGYASNAQIAGSCRPSPDLGAPGKPFSLRPPWCSARTSVAPSEEHAGKLP